MTDRGVSEAISFVLVFSLITATVGVVYVAGIGGLEDARDAERIHNAERAFDVLADNLNDIHRRNAPSRATEIKLDEAELHVGEPTTMTVTVTSLASDPSYSVDVYPIVYSAGTGSKIVLEDGAVLRADPSGAVMKREPDTLFLDDEGTRTAVVPFLQTRGRGSQSAGGSTTVLVRAERALSEVLTARTAGPYTVNYTIRTTATRAPAWERHLDEEIGWASDPCDVTGGGTVECTFETDRLYVTATRIDVTFS